MRLICVFLAALVLAGPLCQSQDKPRAAEKPKKKKTASKKKENPLATPKSAYRTWRKALDAEWDSDEAMILRECYSDNPAWDKRDEMLGCLVELIKADEFEFAEATTSGDRADVILKNKAGQTLKLGFVKEADFWRLDRIPDKRPLLKKLLNPILIIPVFVLILLLTLWRRRAVLQAMERAKEE